MLEARIVKQRPHCRIDVRLLCGKGSLLALTGPSGAGKTTIIRILAGLERPDAGYISCHGSCWYNDQDKTWLASRKRRVGYVFQEHTLFPHLSVADNVGFSCTSKKQVQDLLGLFRIGHLARSMPHQISGGERQRTALAQALASRPGLLLLDEPFSALDTANRLRLRRELKQLKTVLDIPIILVTHDLEEASALGDIHIRLPEAEVFFEISDGERLTTQTAPCASHPL